MVQSFLVRLPVSFSSEPSSITLCSQAESRALGSGNVANRASHSAWRIMVANRVAESVADSVASTNPGRGRTRRLVLILYFDKSADHCLATCHISRSTGVAHPRMLIATLMRVSGSNSSIATSRPRSTMPGNSANGPLVTRTSSTDPKDQRVCFPFLEHSHHRFHERECRQ